MTLQEKNDSKILQSKVYWINHQVERHVPLNKVKYFCFLLCIFMPSQRILSDGQFDLNASLTASKKGKISTINK